MITKKKPVCITGRKDASPGDTIKRIRKILDSIHVALTEETYSSTSKTFSTVLRFDDGTPASYGKGVSRDMCRASAYGEFMEWLQNLFTAKPFHLSEAVLGTGGFRFGPDEKTVSAAYVAELSRDYRDVYTPKAAGPAGRPGRQDRIKNWLRLGKLNGEKNFVATPYCSLIDGRIRYLPWQLLTLYRSNGMCSGNTREEALVQGISEILERVVNRVFITTSITPPDIPRSLIKKCRSVARIVEEIERGGKYRVLLKDCSLGKGLPVLGSVLINMETQAYMVNFGAHPCFETALERTLTEALQGFRLDEKFRKSLQPFSFSGGPVPGFTNCINSVRLGRGQYPDALFRKEPDYQFKPWGAEAGSNEELLRRMLRLAEKMGHDVLVRDRSFLGFPTYQVIMPGFSEVEEPVDQFIRALERKAEIAEIIRKPGDLAPDEAGEVLSFLASRLPFIIECHKVSELLLFPVKSSFPWDLYSFNFFLLMLAVRSGKYSLGAEILKRIVPDNPAGGAELRCVRSYLGALKLNLPRQEIAGVLGRFYAPGLVTKVMREWGSDEGPLGRIKSLPCPDCRSCDSRAHCLKEKYRKLFEVLKGRLAGNPIEQLGLRELALNGRRSGVPGGSRL